MILLPDEDEDAMPEGAQLTALIGEGLRRSVAWVEPSGGFEARLTAALDAVECGRAGLARQAAPVAEAVPVADAKGRAASGAGADRSGRPGRPRTGSAQAARAARNRSGPGKAPATGAERVALGAAEPPAAEAGGAAAVGGDGEGSKVEVAAS